MQYQPTPVIDALESVCDVFDAIDTEQLSSPLQSTRYRLHRILKRTGSVSDEQLCVELADSLADVVAEARLMSSEPSELEASPIPWEA